jgi:hypothetical protein
VRRADEALGHRGSGLDGQQCVHQCGIIAATTLGQGFEPHKVLLRAVPLDGLETTGGPDGTGGAHAGTDDAV